MRDPSGSSYPSVYVLPPSATHYIFPERLSLEFLIYLVNVRDGSMNTIAAYGNDLRQFADWMSCQKPDRTIEEVDRRDIRAFIDHLVQRKLSKATIYRRTEAVKSFFRYLFKARNYSKQPGAVNSQPKPRETPSRLHE